MTSSAPHTSPDRTASAGARSACQHACQPGPGALRASLPDGHPIATFLDEHQAILACLERLAEIAAAPSVPERRAGLEELARLASHLIGVEPHHQREEQVLFPAMQERGIHGPPEVMASEHVRLRALKHALADFARRLLAGDRSAWHDAQATAEALIQMLRAHIAKEDGVLYPLALQAIHEPSVWADLRRRCDAIGYCCRVTASQADGHT